MTLNGWLQILFFLLAVFVVTRPLGAYMARVFSGQYTWLDPAARPIERLICSSNPRLPDPVIASWTSCHVVNTLPSSTTNMTGFLAMVRGCSFRNESRIALRTICGSQTDRDRARVCVDICQVPVPSSQFPVVSSQSHSKLATGNW